MNMLKVGDKVHHYYYGRGTIKAAEGHHIPYFVEFDKPHDNLHGGGWGGLYGKDKSCYCLAGDNLTVVAKTFNGNK